MNKQEVAAVVAVIALGDNRKVDAVVIAFWVEAIGDQVFADCMWAVNTHRRESTEYLMPAHLIAGVRRARDVREREVRKSRPAIESRSITLDREQFEAETVAAIAVARASRGSHCDET